MKMLYKEGSHHNISYDKATSIPMRRKMASFRGLQDPLGVSPQVSPITPAHGDSQEVALSCRPAGLTFLL